MNAEIYFPVGNGQFAVTELVGSEAIWGFAWNAKKACRTTYAVASGPYRNRKTSFLQMHRLLIGANPGELTDHKDGDGLNNRKNNLRKVTNRQNAQNLRHKSRGRSSQYKGVCLEKSSGKWVAEIRINGKGKKIGRFIHELDAAKAYDAAAIKYFGEYASPNFP